MKSICTFLALFFCFTTPLRAQLQKNRLSYLRPVSEHHVESKTPSYLITEEFFQHLYHPKGYLSLEDREQRQLLLNAMPSDPGKKSRASGWEFMGPQIVKNPVQVPGDPSDPYVNYAGRISTVEDQQYLRVSSASGGLFQYVSFGTWFPISETLPMKAIGTFASNPLNPNHILVGTGEYAGSYNMFPLNAQVSAGLWETRDGGYTWKSIFLQWPGGPQPSFKRIIFDPSDTAKVWAASSYGVYYTLNSGGLWQWNSYGSIGLLSCIATDFARCSDNQHFLVGLVGTNNPSCVYYNAGFTGNGQSLGTELNVNNKFPGDVKFAYSASNPATVYASCFYYDDTTSVIFKSTNFGAPGSWTRCTILDNGQPTYNIHNGQGFRDNCIAVSPVDANKVLVGGVRVCRSTDGQNFTIIDTRHPDNNHFFWKSPTQVYVSNDGGLYRSLDSGKIWQDNLLDYLPVIQPYTFDVGRIHSDRITMGSQDNGTIIYDPILQEWQHTQWGDGFAAVYHPFFDSVCYSTTGLFTQGNAFQRSRSTNHGKAGSWQSIENGIASSQQFNQPLVTDFVSPNYLYTSSGPNLYLSTNQGQTWDHLNPNSPSPANTIKIVVSHTTNPYVYFCFAPMASTQWKVTLLKVGASGNTLQYITQGNLGIAQNDYVRSGWSEFNSLSSTDTAVLCIGGVNQTPSNRKVVKTVDGAQTWTNCTGNLPFQLSVTSIICNPGRSKEMIIGTDNGCYKTDDNGVTWYKWDFGFPPGMIVSDLKFSFQNNKGYVVASTFGRGIWKREIQDVEPFPAGLVRTEYRLPEITVYPNPASQFQTILFELLEESTCGVQLINMQGQIVNEISPARLRSGEQKLAIYTGNLKPGIYQYVITINGRRDIKRIVIQ